MSDADAGLTETDGSELQLLKEIISEEIAVRIALEDNDVDDPEWPARLAELVADAIVWRFDIRELPPEKRPYRRLDKTLDRL